MNIDLGSFAFGSSLKKGSGTCSWGTAFGQSSPLYKYTNPGCEQIVIGMVYCSAPKGNFRMPLGKGGHISKGDEDDTIQLTSIFHKVYINGIAINYPFMMAIIKEESESHFGRRSLKYSDKITFDDGKHLYLNSEFIEKVRSEFEMTDNACWFVYAIEILNQDELHLKMVLVNRNDSCEYQDSNIRKSHWMKLIPEEDKYLNSPAKYLIKKGDIYDNIIPLQQIFYGAPGTGKSHEINKQTAGYAVIRTTFHPDSDYSTFVGCYKPSMMKADLRDGSGHIINDASEEEKNKITYKFVKQAFLKAYLGAWKKYSEAGDENAEPQFLVIEEINRGNCAQIFGDLFQLLDREDNGFSSYPIDADTDLQQEIANAFVDDAEYKLEKDINIEDAIANYTSNYGETLSADIQNGRVLLLPPNLFIWATMNTSDQSLFPIDSAFKRRWDWKYMPINTKKESWSIRIDGKMYSWSDFLDKMNYEIGEQTSSEDKKLGFYFCKAENNVICAERFVSKVLFYIYNDVFKDYEFDRDFFKRKSDNKVISFQSLYDCESGNVNEAVVAELLDNLEVDKEEMNPNE